MGRVAEVGKTKSSLRAVQRCRQSHGVFSTPCLFVLLLFVDSFPHNEIILWLVLMLMAGALICFGGACWLAARSMGKDDEPPGQD